jgi:hypothetical protein
MEKHLETHSLEDSRVVRISNNEKDFSETAHSATLRQAHT